MSIMFRLLSAFHSNKLRWIGIYLSYERCWRISVSYNFVECLFMRAPSPPDCTVGKIKHSNRLDWLAACAQWVNMRALWLILSSPRFNVSLSEWWYRKWLWRIFAIPIRAHSCQRRHRQCPLHTYHDCHLPYSIHPNKIFTMSINKMCPLSNRAKIFIVIVSLSQNTYHIRTRKLASVLRSILLFNYITVYVD